MIDPDRYSVTQEQIMGVIDEYVSEDRPIDDIIKEHNFGKTAFYWGLRKYELVDYYREQRRKRDAHIRELMRGEALSSLRKKVNGYQFEQKEAEGVYKKDEHGNMVFIPTKTKKKQVHVTPSDTAIIYALNNLDPEHWKTRTHEELSGEIRTGIDWDSVPVEDRKKVIKLLKQKAEKKK